MSNINTDQDSKSMFYTGLIIGLVVAGIAGYWLGERDMTKPYQDLRACAVKLYDFRIRTQESVDGLLGTGDSYEDLATSINDIKHDSTGEYGDCIGLELDEN